jgi:hypothetical protein
MAVIAIILVPNPFALDNFLCQLIRVRAFRDGGMGVDGEPNEDHRANRRPPDKKIPCSFLLHRILLRLFWDFNLD